jgi:hypothetical protein
MCVCDVTVGCSEQNEVRESERARIAVQWCEVSSNRQRYEIKDRRHDNRHRTSVSASVESPSSNMIAF